MASFYNAETSEPIKVMYISSSGNGNVVVRSPLVGMSMRKPEVIVANGQGAAEPALLLNAPTGDYRWKFNGLTPGASIVVLDSKKNILGQIPVKRLDGAGSYKWIMKRFNSRGMKIDLDSYMGTFRGSGYASNSVERRAATCAPAYLDSPLKLPLTSPSPPRSGCIAPRPYAS